MSAHPAGYDVFIDPSCFGSDASVLRHHLDSLANDAGLAGIAGRMTLCGLDAPPEATCGLRIDAVIGRPAIEALMMTRFL